MQHVICYLIALPSSYQSADVPTCVVPRTLSSYGDRTFVVAGPRLWNCLPVQLRNPDITYRCSDDSWRNTFSFFRKHEHYGTLWLWYAAP